MDPETCMVYGQKAVVWEVAALADAYGDSQVYEGSEIDVRWEDVTTEVKDAENNSIAVDTLVYVLQDIPVGSMMWLGALADLPSPVTAVKRVVKFDSTADVRGRVSQRTAYLTKQSNTLPPIVGTGS